MTATTKTFEGEWPALERRLRSFLTSRGVPVEDRDDVVGIRLMSMWSEVDWSRSVWNLSTTIATRVWYDDLRRSRRHQLVDEIPEVASSEDPESLTLARLELSRVGSALAKLNPRYRRVLLGELVDVPVTQGRHGTLNVVRLRARRRLSTILGRVIAPVGLLGRRIRVRVDEFLRNHTRGHEYANGLTSSGLNVLAALVVATAGGAGSQSVSLESARPEPVRGLFSAVEIRSGMQGLYVDRTEGERRAGKHAPSSRSRSALANNWREVRDEYDNAVGSYHDGVDTAQRTYASAKRSGKQHRDAHKDAWRRVRDEWQDARDVDVP